MNGCTLRRGPQPQPSRLFVLTCVAAACFVAGAAAPQEGPLEPTWSVDPKVPGDSPPAEGESLFDALFATTRDGRVEHAVPFPFAALLDELRRRSGDNVRAVLIPLGRSLQRRAAAPDYFESPRVVAAVVGDATSATSSRAPLKDRLFLGYQQRSATIEVISYNEDAGRFEFQVVRAYKDNASPEVRYPRRAVCTRCHQNHAPIFSKALWDETNANPGVAARLAAIRSEFHGVPAAIDVDVADAFDAATDRANGLAVVQRVWREACGADRSAAAVDCRAGLLLAALRYASSGRKHARTADERQHVSSTLQRNWPRLWPAGLAIPDPDLPNRRLELFVDARGPLDLPGALRNGKPLEGAALTRVAEIAPQLAPSNARAPSTIWYGTDLTEPRVDDLVAGVASFFSSGDLSEVLGRAAAHPAASTGVSNDDFAAVGSAVRALAARTVARESDAFAAAPLRRGVLLRELLAELGGVSLRETP